MTALLIQVNASMLDVRWTHFQDPLRIEDALGGQFPVPSEYDFRMLQIIIKGRYSDGPIAQDVQSGDYELSYAFNSRLILSPDQPLRPGSHVIMGVFLESEASRCPNPECGSLELTPARGGGNRW